MYKRLKAYLLYIEGLLDRADATGSAQAEWDAIAREHLVQISFFQHERLIHLIVTLAFALMELACALVTICVPQPITALLMLLFAVLLVPYVVHYYHLENGTQALYEQYDRIVARMQVEGLGDLMPPLSVAIK